jgi:hypothetical protein
MAHPIIQAPPVTNATTGFGPSKFFGKYKSNLKNHHCIRKNIALSLICDKLKFTDMKKMINHRVKYLFLG